MSEILILVIIGLVAGILGGTLGIGGAVVVIPSLMFFLGLSQHEAQGTSLAFMIPPIGILAAFQYSKQGYVNWKYALVLSLMFFLGAYFGSQIATHLPAKLLKKIFGGFILIIAIKMIFGK